MLAKAFRCANANRLAPHRAMLLHCFNVLIHSMVRPQPLALTGVTCEHVDLPIKHIRNIDQHRRLNHLT